MNEVPAQSLAKHGAQARVALPRFGARGGLVIGRLAMIGSFVFFLYPLSIAGLSVNYSFVLLPMTIVLLHGRLRNPGDMLIIAMAFYVLVFFVATLYQVDLFTQTTRRFTSFVIFMSIFLYAFITIDQNKIAAFKIALVVVSVYFSIESAYTLLQVSAERLVGYEAKDLVGSQRYGFIYLLAIWLAYLDKSIKDLLGIARYPALAVLMAGLVLTFSRSSIVAIIASFLLFSITKQANWLTHVTIKGVLRACATFIGIAAIVIILFRMFPIVFDFFSVRLFGFLIDSESVRLAMSDVNSSEGTRVLIAMSALDFLVRNPFTGSGYLGVWILPDLPANSAHNQYLDVLFRTGFVGLFFYGCILIGVMRDLWRNHESLFWGMIGVLVYGLFHETFKESQGAFVLAFLLGMMAQSWRDRPDRRRLTPTAHVPRG